jgi:hypothetical protein
VWAPIVVLPAGPITVTVTVDPVTVTPGVMLTGQAVTVTVDVEAFGTVTVPVTPAPAGIIDPVTNTWLVEPDPVLVSTVAGMPYATMPEPITAVHAVHLVMPDPAACLGPLGRPRADQYLPVITTETLGYVSVVVNGVDVTFLRGVPAQVGSITENEPFGWATATVTFPQLSPFENPATGDRALIRDGYNIDVTLVSPTGTHLETLFEGIIIERDQAVEDATVGVTITCTGALYQADYILASQRLVVNEVDIAPRIYNRLNIVPGRRYRKAATDSVTTGIMNHDAGSWQPLLTGFIQDMLAQATTADGANQWTLACDPGRKPVLRLKDRSTVHHTVTLGTPGVSVTLHRDITQATTQLFGQGVDDNRHGYANLKLPYRDDLPGGNVMRGAWYAPFAGRTDTEPWLYDSDGEHLWDTYGNPVPNPGFDPTVLRVERWRSFTDGLTKTEAITVAAAEVSRDGEPGWTGTIRLRVDPEATHRWQIRAGHNILVKGWEGAGLLVHIASVSRTGTGEVTLTVDSKARDLLTLDAIEQRNRDAVGPARRKGNPRRVSELQGNRPVIDSELAGWIEDVPCPAGEWKVRRIPLGTAGTIVGIDLTCSTPSRFAVALFTGEITAARLDALVGNPLQTRTEEWTNRQPFGGDEYILAALAGHGWLDTVGGPGQAAGYWPGTEDAADAVTGRHVDDGVNLAFDSQSELWVYVAFWCETACTMSGRLTVAPQR